MRKIISKYEQDKKKRRNQFIIGGVLMTIMLISVLGYAFQGQLINPAGGSSSNGSITYNGITFENQSGFWVTTYKNQNLVFTYNPSEITNSVNITENINDISGKPLYIYSDDNNAESELTMNLAEFANGIIPLQSLSNEDCSNNEIIIQNNSIPSVNQEQNCILISGQGQDLIAMTDNVLFKLFGIRQ